MKQKLWELYEWRWKIEGWRAARIEQPLWIGKEDLAGKTILLHPGQGLGDIILTCRYLPMVEALGAKVIIMVPGPLTELISTVTPSAQIFTHRYPAPADRFSLSVDELAFGIQDNSEHDSCNGSLPRREAAQAKTMARTPS